MKRCKILYLAFWLVVAVVTLTPLRIWGQTKIAVISDPHVMADELTDGGEAWQAFLNSSRKLEDYSKRTFDLLIERFKEEKPDILLITGDLTKDGELKSHEYVVSKLTELEAKGVKVFVIPGNHDMGTSNSNYYSGSTTSHATTLSESGKTFAQMYRDFGYDKKADHAVISSLSYACEPVKGLVLIGIDSRNGSKSNELAAGTLDWVCTQAEKARKAGKQVIAMMHHPLFPHISNAEMYIDTYTVNDYETVRNRLADAGVKVVLTGHFHATDNAMDWNADKTAEIYDLNTGSPVSYSCDYRMLTLTLNGEEPSLTAQRRSITKLEDNADFDTEAKARLMASAKKAAMAKISGNNMAAMLSDELKETLANLAARLFIVHAEGDEQASEDGAALKTTFDGYNNSMITGVIIRALELNTMFYGVVENKSNYGTDRENQCADGELTIPLPNLTPVKSVKLNKTSLTIMYPETGTLTPTILPDDALKDVTWTSSDPTIVSVDDNGVLTPLAIGSATITCTSKVTPTKKATCKVTVKTNEKLVTSVKLDQTTLMIKDNGEAFKLNATVTPDDAYDNTVKWTSSNEAVATVDEDGNVRGVSIGTATITCQSKWVPAKKATCKVTVVDKNKVLAVTGLKLDKTSLTIKQNETGFVTSIILPAAADDREVVWTISNPSVATITTDGNTLSIEGKEIGTAILTCQSVSKPAKKATCKLTVKDWRVPVTKVTLDKTTLTLGINGTYTLTPAILPTDAYSNQVIWTSSKPTVATVSEDGTVTGVAAGTATITCQSWFTPAKKATCRVTVKKTVSDADSEAVTRGVIENDDETFAEGADEAVKTFDVFDLQGRKVASQVTSLDGLPEGIYIVNGKKVVKR